MIKKIKGFITGLPLDAKVKFSIVRNIKYAKQIISKCLGKEYVERSELTLIPQNTCYGHEYHIKRYCNYEDDIYAVIEHGIFFGDVILGSYPFPQEAEIDSFLTFGEYRRKLLQDYYSDKQIFPIGPYIVYAPVDLDFLEELKQKRRCPTGKTLTLFPAHSIAEFDRDYDHGKLAENTMKVARQDAFSNVFVCLHPHDYATKKADCYKRLGIIPITCGTSDSRFLSRQRAIFEMSDLTISNDLGTHIGYSLALGVPHRIIEPVAGHSVDKSLKDLNVELLKRQREEFYNAFGYDGDSSTTQAQYDLVNYYWGLEFIRSSEEMSGILRQCKERYHNRCKL